MYEPNAAMHNQDGAAYIDSFHDVDLEFDDIMASEGQQAGALAPHEALNPYDPQFFGHLNHTVDWSIFSDDLDQLIPQMKQKPDDDVASCRSDCGVSCPSQCGETGHGVCCDDDACGSPDLCIDDACQEASRPCMDQNCAATTVPVQQPFKVNMTDGDKAAAQALASFGEGGEGAYPTSLSHFLAQHTAFGDIELPKTMPCAGLSTDNLFTNQQDYSTQIYPPHPELYLASHIVQYHLPEGLHSQHPPCIADQPSQLIPKCSLPITSGGQLSPAEVASRQCGFQVQDPADFAQHIYQEHASLSPHCFQLHSGLVTDPHGHYVPKPAQGTKFSSTARSHTKPRRPSLSSSASMGLSPGNTLSETPASLVTPPPLSEMSFCNSEAGTFKKILQTHAETPDTKGKILVCRWTVADGTSICGKMFDNEEQLHSHCDAYHAQALEKHDSGFWCGWEGCSRDTAFPQKNKLERHLQTHTGFKPFACPECPERFSAKQALKQHLSAHKGEKPWLCNWAGCGSSFAQQSALTMHYRTHTGEKPLVCDICGKAFGESSNLAKHRRIHAAKRMYDCEICSKDFNRIDQVRRHLKSNHPERYRDLEDIIKRTRENAVKRLGQGRGRRGRSVSLSAPPDTQQF